MDFIRKHFTGFEFHPANALFGLGVAILSFIVIHTALALVRRRLCKLETRKADRPAAELLKATLASTSNVAVIATSVLIGLSVLELPVPWSARVRNLWFIALGAQIVLYLSHAIDFTARRYFRRRTRSPDSPASVAQTLTIWALKTGVWVIFFLAALSNLGINVTAFVASLGIGGIAIALAVQNILGDLFASLSIAVDKPFEVGDFIAVSDFSGTVEHVGLKTTRVRADSGEQVVIANAELLKNTVRNYKRMTERRVQFTLRLNPGTPLELAEKVPAALREVIERQKQVRFDRAHLKTLDLNWIEFEMVYYMLDPAYAKFMDTQEAILVGARRVFDQLGVTMTPAATHFVVEDGEGAAAPVRALSFAQPPRLRKT
ncbi:MAG TPA: mechanosensitive ion channel family protein [Telluria sp.]|nr:mechanosensitive ion channel family protein [Telluria sp.]